MRSEVAGARVKMGDPEDVLRTAAAWASEHASEVSLIDARCVFGRDHLGSAILHAERARDAGKMSARTLAMETLRYVSGRRQVAEAIHAAGLRKDTREVALVVFGEGSAADLVHRLGWTRDDSVLLPGGKDLAILRVTEREAATVLGTDPSEIALERVALLDVLK